MKESSWGNSLAVQWLGLRAFTALVQVQSLVGELRPRKPRGKKKKRIFLGIYTLQRRNTHRVSQQTHYSISMICRFAASTEEFYASKWSLFCCE